VCATQGIFGSIEANTSRILRKLLSIPSAAFAGFHGEILRIAPTSAQPTFQHCPAGNRTFTIAADLLQMTARTLRR
jgi:hypothetical protein